MPCLLPSGQPYPPSARGSGFSATLLIVFKNNLPECVLISPERYDQLLERLFDMELYIEAMERINAPERKVYSREDAMKLLGVTDKDLEDVEVDIE